MTTAVLRDRDGRHLAAADIYPSDFEVVSLNPPTMRTRSAVWFSIVAKGRGPFAVTWDGWTCRVPESHRVKPGSNYRITMTIHMEAS